LTGSFGWYDEENGLSHSSWPKLKQIKVNLEDSQIFETWTDPLWDDSFEEEEESIRNNCQHCGFQVDWDLVWRMEGILSFLFRNKIRPTVQIISFSVNSKLSSYFTLKPEDFLKNFPNLRSLTLRKIGSFAHETDCLPF
jgi:hypothetical protein